MGLGVSLAEERTHVVQDAEFCSALTDTLKCTKASGSTPSGSR